MVTVFDLQNVRERIYRMIFNIMRKVRSILKGIGDSIEEYREQTHLWEWEEINPLNSASYRQEVLDSLPKKFKACFFRSKDGMGHVVVYFPWKIRAHTDFFDSEEGIRSLIEDICLDICDGQCVEFGEYFDSEIASIGFGKRFSRRKRAIHEEWIAEWKYVKTGSEKEPYKITVNIKKA